MTERIALFNHKGGVSKTTTTFNLGWMLASKGFTVVIVDADPQCNLTGLVLGYKGPNEFERFYQDEEGRNLRDGLAPAFESKPQLISPVDCVPVEGCDGLFLLPGHIRLSEYEVTLGIAQELSGSIQALKNLPGAMSYLLRKTAEEFDADYVLVDMSPSLSSINQNLLMTSEFFVVPTNPDYFSVMAINSLTKVLPQWRAWAQRAYELKPLKNASYPFRHMTPEFLGTIVQKYQPYKGAPASSFQKWIDEIEKIVVARLVPTLEQIDMMLSPKAYEGQSVSAYSLASIPDFKSLIAKSQQAQAPVFALTPEQIGQTGVVLDQTLRNRDEFRALFSALADRIIGLTGNASSD